MPEPAKPLRIFISYAHADVVPVRKLYNNLCAQGFQVWFDEENLIPGQDWRLEIKKGLQESEAVIVCLSTISVNKEGFVQKEFRFALDRALEMPEGRIFLIPVRLDECKAPTRLSRYHWVDLFREGGFEKLVKALKVRAQQVAEREKTESEQNEKLRIGFVEAEKEKLVTQKAEDERLTNEKTEKERIARQKAEDERIAQEKAEQKRILREKAEADRIAKQKAENERKAREKAEKEQRPRFTRAMVWERFKIPALTMGSGIGFAFLWWLAATFIPTIGISTPTLTSTIAQSSPPILTLSPTFTPLPTQTPQPMLTLTSISTPIDSPFITPTPTLGIGSTVLAPNL